MESLCISGASFVSSVPGRQLRHSLLQRNLIHVRRGIQRLKAVETELYPIEPLIDDVKYQDGMFSVSGRIYSEVPSYDIYSTLTDYDSLPRVFHNVDHCSVRVSEDGRKFIHQMVLWNFLIFRGSFETALEVSEDFQNLKLSFSLLESAFMKQFIGTWSVEEDSGTGISMVRHSLCVAPSVRPPQKIGDLTKRIFEAQVRMILQDLSAELSRHRSAD